MGYYLVARDTINNSFKILELKSRWYLKNGTDVFSRSNSLEAIDLVTTRFSSKEEMTKRLVENKYLPHPNYDLFIASKYKKDGVEKLKIQETIYNCKPSRINEFRTIAYNSLNKKIKCEENMRLLDKFITKSIYSNVYTRIVNDRLTGIPYKFIEDFRKIQKSNNSPYTLKYKANGYLENYGLSRSIIDSLNRFDDLKSNDTYRSHIIYFKNLNDGRMSIYKELLEVCDKNYVEGQLSIFDIPKQEPNIIEKKNYVIEYLKNIGLSRFDITNGKRFISIDDLIGYMTSSEAKILNKGLNTSVVKAAYLYNFHNSKIKTVGTTLGNFAVLQEDMNADLLDLKKSLNSDKIVERTYDFCKTLEIVKEKSLSEDVLAYQKRRDKK